MQIKIVPLFGPTKSTPFLALGRPFPYNKAIMPKSMASIGLLGNNFAIILAFNGIVEL